MILSMTGFGRAEAQSDSLKITAEIKSLNSKQIDLMMRIPSQLRETEGELRNYLTAKLQRGKVELTLTLEETGQNVGATINCRVIERYLYDLTAASEELNLREPEDWWPLLLRLPDAVTSVQRDTTEDDLELCMSAVSDAADALISFRRAEGIKLYDFFVNAITSIGRLLDDIEPMEHERVPKIRARLEEQLKRLDTIEYDQGRLEQELIIYIEKLDVTEEKTRLRSHLSYFLETLGNANDPDAAGGQGKKLGFIAQEMGREINTLGSKSNHAGMQRIVVQMKDILEQIKEQVLNVL